MVAQSKEATTVISTPNQVLDSDLTHANQAFYPSWMGDLVSDLSRGGGGV